jgi:hypothetical protein
MWTRATVASVGLIVAGAMLLLSGPVAAQKKGPGCAFKKTINECMACLQANGMAGPSGGLQWCAANMKKK